jgi:hypothetical protein
VRAAGPDTTAILAIRAACATSGVRGRFPGHNSGVYRARLDASQIHEARLAERRPPSLRYRPRQGNRKDRIVAIKSVMTVVWGISRMNRTGISPVTTRTVVSSPANALACKGSPRDQCGFRLWRTPPGYGKPDAGVCVVLCCKAVVPRRDGSPQGRPDGRASGRTHSRRPEPAGRISRRHETRKAT